MKQYADLHYSGVSYLIIDECFDKFWSKKALAKVTLGVNVRAKLEAKSV